MQQHHFTIIVPTRERADTLYWTLRTLVAQDYENLTILVSDNYSQDNTKEVVDSFQDKRIKYVNTGKRVEMALNWEFALSHVKEGYVGFLGDDDGYLLGSIKLINYLINKYPTQAITWKMASYGWPNLDYENYNNAFGYSFGNTVFYKNSIKELNYLEKNYHDFYHTLFNMYPNGVVSIDVINRLKGKNNRFFNACAPDIYSAIAITKELSTFLYTDICLSMSGTSKKSNSGSSLGANAHSNSQNLELNKFFTELKEMPLYPKLPRELDVLLVAIADAYINMEIHTLGYSPSEQKWLKIVIDKSLKKFETGTNNNDLFESKLIELAEHVNMGSQIRNKIAKIKRKRIDKPTQQNDDVVVSGLIDKDSLRFEYKADFLGVKNIYDAASFVSYYLSMTNYDHHRINFIKAPYYNKFYSRVISFIDRHWKRLISE